MNTAKSTNRRLWKARRFVRISLRTWFVILSLYCLVVFLGGRAWQRNELQKIIIAEATLVYDGNEWHAKTQNLARTGFGGGGYTSGPQPRVETRDSSIPWIGQWSGGSVIFCRFDSITYSVSNVSIPDWTNDILATGELRRASLRLNNPNINWNLLTRCRALEELSLWGRSHDPQALRGIDRLQKLVKLNLIDVSGLQYDQLLPAGLPPNLLDVRLVDCNLQSHDLLILKGCTKLESLDLASNPINLQALSEVGLPPNLKSIGLQGTRCGKEDLRLLARCKRLTKLNFLAPGADLRSLDGFELPVSLEHLSLSRAILDATSFRWFSQLPKLKSLSLNSCQFEDADAEGIVLSPTLDSFSACRTNAGRHVCAMLANASEMTSLNLRATKMDDETLLALDSKPNLTDLRLGENNITDASASWFSDLKKLNELWLRETEISDRLFEVSPHLKKTDYLNVKGTKVSQPLQEAIERANQVQLRSRWTDS